MIPPTQRRRNGTRLLKRCALWLVVLLTLFYVLFPVYWTFNTSLKTPATVGILTYWPERLFSINYQVVSSNENVAAGLHNSLIVSGSVVVLTLLLGAATAYAVGRLRFRGQGLLRYTALTLIGFPQIALIGGLYQLVTNPCVVYGGTCREHQLYNTVWALIFSDLLLTLPLTIWFLAAFFRDLPVELEEAAYVDGATPLQAFYRIILPLAAPGLVTTGLISFITAWNEFLFAVSFTVDLNSRTAPVALSLFGDVGFGVVLALAGSLLISGPPVLLALAFQRQLTAGLTGVEPGEDDPRWLRRGGRYALAWRNLSGSARVLLAVLAFAALVFAAHGWNAVAFPYSLDYGEGPLLDQTLRLAHGENIYRADLQVPPFTVANYPPLYVLVQVPLAWLFGPAFWYGRLLSWLAMTGAALFVGLILHTLTRDRLAALIGGLTLLALPYISYWAPLYRIDSLALCLSLAALWVVVRWSQTRWGVAATALLLVAAIYTRQSYGLAAPLAAVIWLWMNSLRRQAATLAGLVAGLGAGVFVLLNVYTSGGFFFNIITANINAFKVDLLQEYLGELWRFAPFPVLVTGLFVLLAGAARVRSWRLVLPYAAGAALAGLTIGKVGSNVNYLLEFCAAMSLASGAAIAGCRSALIRHALMLGLAFQLFVLLPGLRYQLFTQVRLDSRVNLALLAKRIHSTPGAVIADEDLGQLVLAGRPVLFQPFELTQLARAHKWDQAPLLAAIARREYALIMIFKIPEFPLEHDRWTDEMLTQIDQHYTAVEQIGNTVLYRPK